jgi:hypothetical protein
MTFLFKVFSYINIYIDILRKQVSGKEDPLLNLRTHI